MEGRRPRSPLAVDLHVLDVIDAARLSTREGSWVEVGSRPDLLDLRLAERRSGHTHDHTRPAAEQ